LALLVGTQHLTVKLQSGRHVPCRIAAGVVLHLDLHHVLLAIVATGLRHRHLHDVEARIDPLSL
jgi:hypothetical protein